MNDQGTDGYYWSSTAYSSATHAYNLRLYSSGAVSTVGNYLKYYGFPLRCLAEGRKGSSFFPPTPSTNYSLTPLDQSVTELPSRKAKSGGNLFILRPEENS